MTINPAVLADRPAFYFPLDDPAGTVAVNWGSLAQDGTYTGTIPATYPAPLGGKAPLFDGVDDAVTTTDNAALTVADFTLEAWHYPIGTASGFICGKHDGSGGSREWQLIYDSSTGFYQFAVWTNANVQQNLDSPARLFVPGQWTHVAATINAANLRAIYINGREVARTTGSFTRRPHVVSPFNIGNRTVSSALPLKGGVAHVAFYNRVLPANRIWAHSQRPVSNGRLI